MIFREICIEICEIAKKLCGSLESHALANGNAQLLAQRVKMFRMGEIGGRQIFFEGIKGNPW